MHTAGRLLVSMFDYSEMQKLTNYVNDFRTLHPNRKHTKKDQCQHPLWIPATLIPVNTITVCSCGSETETPSCLSCTHCKDHLAPHHSLAEVSDPSTQQKHCYLHISGRKQQRSSCTGWAPIVKQGRKKSKHKERMDQTKFAFPFSQGQELGLAVHNFCYITLVHHSRNCGRTQK